VKERVIDEAVRLNALIEECQRRAIFSGLKLADFDRLKLEASNVFTGVNNWLRHSRRTDKTGARILDELAKLSARAEALNARFTAVIRRAS